MSPFKTADILLKAMKQLDIMESTVTVEKANAMKLASTSETVDTAEPVNTAELLNTTKLVAAMKSINATKSAKTMDLVEQEQMSMDLLCDQFSKMKIIQEPDDCHKPVHHGPKECQLTYSPPYRMPERDSKPPNYMIKFDLAPGHIALPRIYRTLSCPAHATFASLHLALQVAFEWTGTHLYDFGVVDPTFVDYTPVEDENAAAWLIHAAQNTPDGEPLPPFPEREEGASRRFLLRLVDPTSDAFYRRADRLCEGLRGHPRTLESGADEVELCEVFEDPEYRGK